MKVVTHQTWIIVPILFWILNTALAKDIKCDASNKCPKSSPCCSQYGVCGSGAYCLGGCDIRHSYRLDACMPMPRMGDFNTTFSSTDVLEKQNNYLGNSSETDWVYTGYVDSHDDSLLLQMPNHTAGTVISSTRYLWYGKISAKLKTSHGAGVITALILFSDVQDEVDFEFVGYNLTAPQSNYYSQGILDYNNAKNSSTSDTFENYHTYEIDWTEDKIEWLIDGDKVRDLEKKDTWNKTTHRFDFPQTPSRIQMSLWPGGDSANGLGTIEWAGGDINWDSEDIKKNGYYYAYLKDVQVTTYDLPDDVELDGDDDADDLHAFLYNSTDADKGNIYLTNKATWLGSDDATGLDPDNKSKKSSASKSSKGSKSKSKSKSKSSKGTGTVDLPSNPKATSSTTTYDATLANGGFVQNSKQTDPSSSSGKSSSSNAAPPNNFVNTIGLIGSALFVATSLFL